MAKVQPLDLEYSDSELVLILNNSAKAPFILYYDKTNSLYRFFPRYTDDNPTYYRDQWVTAYEAGEMTDEIAGYEFTENFTAPAPYTINIYSIKDNLYVLQGTTGTNLTYTFGTVDGNGGTVAESVDAYYTFKSTSGTQQASKIYNAGTEVSFNIDDYLYLGTNSITILLRGRSTGTTKTIVVTYYVVQLDLSTTFDISRSISENTNFTCTYTVTGQADKTVEFYIDGSIVSTASVSSLESTATRTLEFNNTDGKYAPGKHSLQVRASMMAGDSQFYSNLLYYEFVITGIDLTVILMEYTFPNTQSIFVGSLPGISGEQYVKKSIDWAYYTSDVTKTTATVTWRLYTSSGVETTLATRNADVVEGEVDVKPDPLIFMPTETGNYQLQALIDKEVIESYAISVIANTNGVLETTEGLQLKLSGLGRSNDEPDETLYSWSNNGYSCTFKDMPFTTNAGYNDNAVVFNSGATGTINIKPFCKEWAIQSNNGNVVEIDFETFNVDDEDAPVLTIGDPLETPCLYITSNKAVLKSKQGTQIMARFKSDERVKLAFITYPNSNTNYLRFMFILNNGILAPGVVYDATDTFNLGSSLETNSEEGMIKIGSSSCGIKIYYIRVYNATYTAWQGLNNYMIDSDEDIATLITRNDIFQTGSTSDVDIDKLEGKVNLIKITADVSPLIATSSKTTVTGAMEVTFPEEPSLNITSANTEFSNAGLSTLGLHMSPSMHCKLDKNGNVAYDRDGNPLSKNRWAFISGRVPEKKLRLQANPMDSSGVHNGAFMNMVNKVYPNVLIDGEYVLRSPAQQYVLSGLYSSDMYKAHGADPNNTGWAFPYDISYTPQAKPCVIVYRPDENSPYTMLGDYVMMEEKNANYANGMHSIRDKILDDGTPDPFDFQSGAKGNTLWDNKGCALFENLRNNPFTLFTSSSNWTSDSRALAFEKEYPDDDDLTANEIESSWSDFYNSLIKPLSDTYNNQSKFDSIVWLKVNIYHAAAYYILVLRQCLSDSLVRNLEWTRFEEGGKWIPKWWDCDMQCGLMQDYTCDAEPMTDRDTILKGAYVLSGRDLTSGDSSWFWDACEKNDEFNTMVRKMDQALFDAGWTYENIVKIQDEDFIGKWSEALINKDGDLKYVQPYLNGYNYLSMFQGARTSHRHWFEKTSYDYWDAKRAVGEYKNKVIYVRAPGAGQGSKMYFKAGATSIFGYGLTQDIIETGVSVNKGGTFYLTIKDGLNLLINDPINIYAANKLESVDLHEIALNLAATVEFANSYDSVTGTLLKNINIGVEKQVMEQGKVTNNTDDEGNVTSSTTLYVNTRSVTGFTGLDKMTRLETFNIQGQSNITNGQVDISSMSNLKNYYAAGSNIITFNPCSGNSFEDVQLPLTITSMTMSGVNLTPGTDVISETSYDGTYTTTGNKNGCAITWWNNYQLTSMPTSLLALSLTGMGSDDGTHELVHQWLQMIEANSLWDLALITYRNIYWENIDISDLLTLIKIPTSLRKVTGYIKINGSYTAAQTSLLQEAFGTNVFNLTNATSGICCDLSISTITVSAYGTNVTIDEDKTVNVLQGTNVSFSALGFPLLGEKPTYTWYIIENGERNIWGSGISVFTFGEGNYRIYKDTGVIETTECPLLEKTYQVLCVPSDGGSGTYTNVRIYPREYPNTVTLSYKSGTSSIVLIDDVYQIMSSASYYFNADHKRLEEETELEYDGTMTDTLGGVWEIEAITEGVDPQNYITRTEDYLEGRTSFDEYCMYVKSLPSEEANMKLKYTSNWKNGLSLVATPIQFSLISILYKVISKSDITGNQVLFGMLESAGVTHTDANYYNSMELKRLDENFIASNLLEDLTLFISFKGEDAYPSILRFLKNVFNINLDGCTNYTLSNFTTIPWLKTLSLKNCSSLTGLNVQGLSQLSSINLEGTSLESLSLDSTNTALTTVNIGSPTAISLDNLPKLTPTGITHDSLEPTSLTLRNLPKGFSLIPILGGGIG